MKKDQLVDLIDEKTILPKNVDRYGNIYYGTIDEGIAVGWLHYISEVAPKLADVKPQAPIVENHPYWQQLSQFNGCRLYEGNLDLYGVHGHGEMSESAYPWDWILACLEYDAKEYPIYGSVKEFAPIGISIYESREEALLQKYDSSIIRVDLNSGKISNKWENVDELIYSEVQRLNSQYQTT